MVTHRKLGCGPDPSLRKKHQGKYCAAHEHNSRRPVRPIPAEAGDAVAKQSPECVEVRQNSDHDRSSNAARQIRNAIGKKPDYLGCSDEEDRQNLEAPTKPILDSFTRIMPTMKERTGHGAVEHPTSAPA